MAGRYGLQVRSVEVADAPGLATLLASCGVSVSAAAMAVRIEGLRRGPGTALVAIEWGPPGGIVAAQWLRTLDADAPVALVGTLLVAPDDRRRGIGRLLLKSVAQAARAAGCGALHLAVTPGRASLAAFGRAAGFEEEGAVYARPLRKRPDATAG